VEERRPDASSRQKRLHDIEMADHASPARDREYAPHHIQGGTTASPVRNRTVIGVRVAAEFRQHRHQQRRQHHFFSDVNDEIASETPSAPVRRCAPWADEAAQVKNAYCKKTPDNFLSR
jgi:hypothetical protein